MSEGRRRSVWRGPRSTGGCGCASFIVVLTLGLLLSLFNTDIGIGISVRVPPTEINATAAGSVGKKENASAVLPGYVRGHLGSNQDSSIRDLLSGFDVQVDQRSTGLAANHAYDLGRRGYGAVRFIIQSNM